MAKAELSYCAQQLRHYDRDRYLTALFAPAAAREDLLALYTFNLELAATAERVSEAMLGEIRLQWWREALDGIEAGSPRHHEVVEALARAMAKHDLDRALLDRLIDARARDLDPAPPENLTALETYARDTSSSLMVLALQVLGHRGPDAAQTVEPLGLAWSLIGLLRALPFHAQARRCYLPTDLLKAKGLTLGQVFQGKGEPALGQAVGELLARAEEHLEVYKSRQKVLAREARPVKLLAVLAARHAKALRGVDCNPFALAAKGEDPTLMWHLVWATLLRRA